MWQADDTKQSIARIAGREIRIKRQGDMPFPSLYDGMEHPPVILFLLINDYA